jgi:hypothetical protein
MKKSKVHIADLAVSTCIAYIRILSLMFIIKLVSIDGVRLNIDKSLCWQHYPMLSINT